jgi:hypothetical protein
LNAALAEIPRLDLVERKYLPPHRLAVEKNVFRNLRNTVKNKHKGIFYIGKSPLNFTAEFP